MTIRGATAQRLLAVVVSSFLLACSFPLPPQISAMEGASAAWLGLIPLILVARLSRPKAAFWWGWLCGFLFWLVSVAWLLQLRHTWGFLPMVVLAWMALAAYCGLYVGLFTSLLSAVLPSPDGDSLSPRRLQLRSLALVVLTPILWVGCEYLRGVLFTGFPWNALGVSQYRNIAMLQLATWGGVYAVSGIVVLLNAAIAMTVLRMASELRRRERRRRVHFELMLGLVSFALCLSWGVRTVHRADATPEHAPHVLIAAVQPQFQQVQKWSEAFRFGAYRALQEQTERAVLSRPALVIWPETSVPDLLRDDPLAQETVASLVSKDTLLLVGGMDYEQPSEDRVDYYNAGFLVGDGGSIVGNYRKRHLVPFGEYVPFENQIALIKRLAPLGFSCMPGDPLPLMELPVGVGDARRVVRFGDLICFEDVFPYLARHDVRMGARLLVNQTNDAWFEGSAASRQHMANAVFRAVENRVPLVRCANMGVTCFVNRVGRIKMPSQSDDAQTFLRGIPVFFEVPVPDAGMSLTPYTRFGDWLFALPCSIFVIGLLLVMGFRSRLNLSRRAFAESVTRS